MYTAIAGFLAPYAKKIVAGFIVTLLVIGAYFYWKHEVVSEALDKERAAWNERDAETERKGKEILRLRNIEIERTKEQQRNNYIGAIEAYAKHIQSLNDELNFNRNKRLFVNTTQASCDRNPEGGKTGGAERTRGESSGILQTELEPETAETIRANAAEVETGARLCEILIEKFLIPESVMR